MHGHAKSRSGQMKPLNRHRDAAADHRPTRATAESPRARPACGPPPVRPNAPGGRRVGQGAGRRPRRDAPTTSPDRRLRPIPPRCRRPSIRRDAKQHRPAAASRCEGRGCRPARFRRRRPNRRLPGPPPCRSCRRPVSQVGEPPLAGTGPMQSYHVRGNGETMHDIARRTLGTGERCTDVYKLNPALHPEDVAGRGHAGPPAAGRLPAGRGGRGLKPLPAMRPDQPGQAQGRAGADRHLPLQPRREANPHAAPRRPRSVRRHRPGAGVARPGPVPVADRSGPSGTPGRTPGAFAGARDGCARLQAAVLRPDGERFRSTPTAASRSPTGWPSSPG